MKKSLLIILVAFISCKVRPVTARIYKVEVLKVTPVREGSQLHIRGITRRFRAVTYCTCRDIKVGDTLEYSPMRYY